MPLNTHLRAYNRIRADAHLLVYLSPPKKNNQMDKQLILSFILESKPAFDSSYRPIHHHTIISIEIKIEIEIEKFLSIA